MNNILLKPLFEKKADPLTLLLRDIFKDNKYAMSYLGALSIGLGFSQTNTLNAEEADSSVEEIIVTASKRATNIQDLPMAVQAISAEELEAKNITDFDDIAALSPSITLDSSGTGNSYFYIRGVSDGGFGNRAGAQASTAYYIDEQPVSTIGGNPDPHIYDINRVEILKGPQGTLYGSSSQSGTVRIITNKPDPSGFEAGFDIERGDINDGSTDESLETFVNIPLGTNTALRISAYDISNGGWIDNVPSTVSFYYTGATIDNSSYVEDDYNWIDKSGHRVRLGHDMDSGTTIDLSFLSHESFSNGSWETDVAEGARKNSRFADETFDDEFTQTSLTINGNLSDDVEFTFNTSIFDREIDYTYDYTNYVYTNYYDSYSAYAYDYDYYASTDARMFYVENDQYDRQSTEFRMQSTNDSGFRWILGVFIEDQELAYSTTYNMPAISNILTSVPGRWWKQDNVREDSQKAIFGEATWPLSDKTDLTVGMRAYKNEANFDAKDGYMGYYQDHPILSWAAGRTEKYTKDFSDVSPKINIAHKLNDDVLLYATYSEGFRPSGTNRLNRQARESGIVPATYDSDTLTNFEAGFKSTLADGKIVLNGNLHTMNWDDFQSTSYIYDLLTVAFVQNVGQATISGLELESYFNISDSFSASLMLALTDPEFKEDIYDLQGQLSTPKGNQLAYVPTEQFVMSMNKDFVIRNRDAYVSYDHSYTGESYQSSANTDTNASYSLANLRFGVNPSSKGSSDVDDVLGFLQNASLEVYLENVHDADPTLGIYDDFGDVRRTGSKPRTIGLRLRYRF